MEWASRLLPGVFFKEGRERWKLDNSSIPSDTDFYRVDAAGVTDRQWSDTEILGNQPT